MNKIDGPHNGYPTDIDTGMGRIFIQQGATIHTLPPVDIPKQYIRKMWRNFLRSLLQRSPIWFISFTTFSMIPTIFKCLV